jgi:phospholipid/cholesterol/gamma-HCH transport system ATP-binding protein
MIRFEGVRKSFGDREVIKGLDFTVKNGEILFILGTSGTGKSVSLKMLVGLMKPSSGRIYIDNRDVTDLGEEEYLEVRRTCGMVFQQPALFDSLTIFDNVAFGLRKHYPDLNEDQIKIRVRECLGLVHLHNVEEKLPQQISYGMQKRASLARTVAVGPRILLFDEPTTGLDPNHHQCRESIDSRVVTETADNVHRRKP